AAPVQVRLTDMGATALNGGRARGFANVSSFTGSQGYSSQLFGPTAALTWTLTGANSGSVSGILPNGFGTGSRALSGFGYITGSSGDDVFRVLPGASLSGAIDASAGNNILDYSAYKSRVVVDLATSGTTVVRNASGNGFYNFQQFVGAGNASDLIVGPNA